LVQQTIVEKYVQNDHLIYQMTTWYTKWLYNILNGHKLNQHFPFQGPLKCTLIGNFGMQIYQLATLLKLRVFKFQFVLRFRFFWSVFLSFEIFADVNNFFLAKNRCCHSD
jgi:hypothetical protein